MTGKDDWGRERESERKSWDNKDIPVRLASIHFPSLDLPCFPKKLITGQEVGKEKLNRGEERRIHL